MKFKREDLRVAVLSNDKNKYPSGIKVHTKG